MFLQSSTLLLVVLVNNLAPELCTAVHENSVGVGGGAINNSLTFHVKIVNKAGGSGVGGRGEARGAELLRSEGTASARVRGSSCQLPATS